MTQAKAPMMLDEERAKYVAREIKYEQEIRSLRQQLAAAQAAIKIKNEALECCKQLAGYPEDVLRVSTEALAIQPDDSALKAWLGEPVGEVDSIDIDEDGQPSAWVMLQVDVELGDQLYMPKGMPK